VEENIDINNEMFSIGDIVTHATKGSGRIVEITNAPESRVGIQMKDGTVQSISVNLVELNWTKLPLDGFEAQILKNRDAIRDWENTAPLRLVALVLTDLRGTTGKPADIRRKLESNQLLSSKWESWWKKVQPIIKTSEHFGVGHDGTYRLLVQPDQVPVEPIKTPDKKKEAGLSLSQLREKVHKLSNHEIRFEEIEGAKAKHRVAREVVRLSRKSPEMKEIILQSLSGAARPAGIMLSEVVKKPDQDTWQVSEALLNHISELVSEACINSEKGIIEHLGAKVNVFKDSAIKVLSKSNKIPTESLNTITFGILSIVVQLAREDRLWRNKIIQANLAVVAGIIDVQPNLIREIGKFLSTIQNPLSVGVSVAIDITNSVPKEKQSVVTCLLMQGALETSIEFADRLVQGLQPRDLHIRWWISNLGAVTAGIQDPISTAETILELIGTRILPKEIPDYVQLVVMTSLIYPRIHVPLIAREKISQWILEAGAEVLESESQSGALEELFSMATNAVLSREKDTWQQLEQKLITEMEEIKSKLQENQKMVVQRETTINQLRSGYHMPEKWVEYGARKDLLENLGYLYQEIYASPSSKSDEHTVKWVLNSIETILLRNGASRFGTIDTVIAFDPSQYVIIPGSNIVNGEAMIESPGFFWKDPEGNRIVLVKARVTDIVK